MQFVASVRRKMHLSLIFLEFLSEMTFPTKVPSDSLGWIGSLKRTSDKSLFPMALGSCGHRITHQLRPINMNGRSILAVTSIFEQLGANPVGGSIHLSNHCLSRLLLGIIKTSWHLIGTGRTARARGEACWRILLRGWEPLPSLSLSMAAMAPVARLLERVTSVVSNEDPQR